MNDLVHVQPESTSQEQSDQGQADAGSLSETAGIEFAIVDGRPRHITEPRDKLKGATCPACGEPLTVRKGAIRAHHFAHRMKQTGCEMDSEPVKLRVSARMQMLEWLKTNERMAVQEVFACGCSRHEEAQARHWKVRWDDASIDASRLAAVDTPIALIAQGKEVAHLFITDSKADMLPEGGDLSGARITVEHTLESLGREEAFPLSHVDERCPLCAIPDDVWPGPTGSPPPGARRVDRSVVLATGVYTISTDGFSHMIQLELHETHDDIGVPIDRALVIGESRMVWATVDIDTVLADPKAAYLELLEHAKAWGRRVERNHITVETVDEFSRTPECDIYGLWNNDERRRQVEAAVALRKEHPELYEAFRVLGCPPWTAEPEFTAAYRRAIQAYHPDRLTDATEEDRMKATEQAAKVNAASQRIREYRPR